MFGFSNKISLKDQVSFSKRLAFLIKANVPILESLKIMRRQSKSNFRKKMMDDLIADVSEGQYLSSSLEKYKNSFGVFALNVIRVGEEAGILDQNLEYLADELHKRQELKKKIIGSMIYPVFISIATLGVTGMITLYVFPKILPIFASIHVKLPLSTRLLIHLNDFIIHYGLITAIIMLALIITAIFTYKTSKPFNIIANRSFLWIPIFGKLLQSYYMANFCRTLGLLLNCQISIVSATNITARATASYLYQKEIYDLAEQISKGGRIGVHLETRPHLFPNVVPELISIGEATGNLDRTLMYLSNHYDDEVTDITKNLSSSIEPILMIFVGIMVGFVAISVITPIYAVTQNLHP